jgi:hypothetical protein
MTSLQAARPKRLTSSFLLARNAMLNLAIEGWIFVVLLIAIQAGVFSWRDILLPIFARLGRERLFGFWTFWRQASLAC